MANFTIELHKVLRLRGAVLETNGDLVGGDIGLSDYPIYSEDHRDTLNRKIINRYLNREIGMESIEMFVHALKRRMHEIMPAYNELYLTTLTTIDPLKTIDMRTVTEAKKVSESETSGTGSTSQQSGAKSRNVNQDFPQFALAGDADYATNAADSNATNEASGTTAQTENGRGQDEDTGESHTTGYQGSQADLIIRARAAIVNVDLAIVEELNDLFMLVWDNGTEWSPQNWKGITL